MDRIGHVHEARIVALIGSAAFWAAFSFLVSVAAAELGLALTPLGWVVFVVSALILNWYLLDVLFPRRVLYAVFGAAEPPMRPVWRFWRKVVLLTCAVLAIAGTITGLGEGPPGVLFARPATKDLSALAILFGVFVAGVGWMFTGFEKEKSDRAAATLQVIRDLMYGNAAHELYRQVLTGISAVRKGGARTRRLTVDETRIKRPGRPAALSRDADRYLNMLDQLAYGVRRGELDREAVEMIFRPRFVRLAYVLGPYIAHVTRAEPDARGFLRARTRTWEHFLWLTRHMPVLASDAVDPARLVLPPDHVVGAGREERSARPRRGPALPA